MDCFATTKFPLSIVLMELAEQLEAANLLLNVCWRPREENEPADALTTGVFRGFDPGLRVSVSLPSRSLTHVHACTPARTRCIDRLERRALGVPEVASLWLTPFFSRIYAGEHPDGF